jgi:hypothetical protein
MDRQKIYDTVKAHLLAQGCKSVELGAFASCLYRGPKDTKCAIGVLIPDALYSPQMENKTVDALLRRFPAIEAHLKVESDADVNFLIGIQDVHDASSPDRWPEVLELLAEREGLAP